MPFCLIPAISVVDDTLRVHQRGRVLDVGALPEHPEDRLLVLRGELVLISLPDELLRGVDEQNGVVSLRLLEHDNAGADYCAEEKIRW